VVVLLLGAVPAYGGPITFTFGGTFGPTRPNPALAHIVDFGSGRFTGSFSYDTPGDPIFGHSPAWVRVEINGNVFESAPLQTTEAWVESNDHHDGFRLRADHPTLPTGWSASATNGTPTLQELNIIFNRLNSQLPPGSDHIFGSHVLPSTLDLNDFNESERILEFFMVAPWGEPSLSTPLGTVSAPYGSSIAFYGSIDTLTLVDSPPPTPVPDTGSTLPLLGLSLVGVLGAARRWN
jgi:hypothetical protein